MRKPAFGLKLTIVGGFVLIVWPPGLLALQTASETSMNKLHLNLNTNKNFAKNNTAFKKACENAGVQPTARQASKYRRGLGSAYRSK